LEAACSSEKSAAPEAPAGTALPWVQTRPGHPYFFTEDGRPWTPIGQNDAISWVEFESLFRRRDLVAVERHLRWLKAHGVNCLRLMLEYAQVRHRYIEKPTGRFVPAMVQLWDDLFALCERVGMRILLTPVDTFWTWIHWRWHPWNKANGGPLAHPSDTLLCAETRDVIKGRLDFAVRRWGGSGALFAWDLWNEIHPAQARDTADCFGEFIRDLSSHVRKLEMQLYGRAHPQTVSLFGPELWLKPHLELREPIYRHPDLDFASIHIYQQGAIDKPRNTVDAARAMADIVAMSLGEIRDQRPFLDTEHGPIHSFKDKHKTLPAPFDDEYFRHMQWAHLASGGAGGGMRWPNRKPHTLTPGMREAQRGLSEFLPLIDWNRFDRRCWNDRISVSAAKVDAFGCGDDRQALLWAMRKDVRKDGTLDPEATPRQVELRCPARSGEHQVTLFDTRRGRVVGQRRLTSNGDDLHIDVELRTDLAVAVRRI
jgi:mannan endo-1,4-beta-mannosidase